MGLALVKEDDCQHDLRYGQARDQGSASKRHMLKRSISSALSGDSVKKRTMRGSFWTILGFGGTNILRLGSNLILTRLLFPEAFGLMALVQVFTTGLLMFSDIGIRTSIIQHPRGDEPDFLNTAWTLQILRGVLLWLAACALALPASAIYDEPMLLHIMPIAGLTALIAGFETTKIATANRHMMLGRQTAAELCAQFCGITSMVVLAYLLQSVWALVLGGLIGAAAKMVLLQLMLVGQNNRLCWDKETIRSVLGFGKFIFLSTVATFAVTQGDRAILGAYVPLAELGVYTVGMLLGTLPLFLARALSNKVVLPLYRLKPPAESEANRHQIFRARRSLIAITLLPCLILGVFGISIINLLYDARYALAGPMVMLFSLGSIAPIVFTNYGGVLLAHGDSKRHFILMVLTAIVQISLLFLGINYLGLFGAILAPGLAMLLVHPLRVVFLSHYKAYDIWGDLTFVSVAMAVTGTMCALNWDQISLLLA